MRHYKTTYQDKRGTEQIVIKSDGSEMVTTIRGINFDGPDFDQLTADKIDHEKFDYQMLADGSGDVTNCSFLITIPIKLYNTTSKELFEENLDAYIVVGDDTTINGLDHELNSLTLHTSFGKFTVEKKLEWMEDALIALQNQLPAHIYINTCLSCKYSNYSPYGNGMFGGIYCFKKIKEQLKSLHDKTDLFSIWTKEAMDKGDIFSVQETFDCEEHQLLTNNDWVYKSWTKTI
ncbi:DUF6304 family protein [uncultured Aquimarina sp.]|uniref:DUF6304 family protein n=1 Tax=uncultured Aquimarina sp. TaxID=575652 RepID=UPI00262AF0A8|nr:DUF6304 family protein [uncultured Aquimarina sp.]